MANVASVPSPGSAIKSKGFIDDNLMRADRDGAVHLQCGRCAKCGAESFPRAFVCPSCLSEDIEPFELSEPGTLYAFSVVHQGPRHWSAPYAVGYVDFPCGLRIFGHIQGPFEQLSIGDTMRARVAELGADASGEPLVSYAFAPEDGHA